MVITATELKSNLGKYLELIETEDTISITKNGRKIAELNSVRQSKLNALNRFVGCLDGCDYISIEEARAERLSRDKY
jgi:prevent-host-death family protein